MCVMRERERDRERERGRIGGESDDTHVAQEGVQGVQHVIRDRE